MLLLQMVTLASLFSPSSKKHVVQQSHSRLPDSFEDRNAAVIENPLYFNEECVKGLPSYDELEESSLKLTDEM